GGVPRRPGRPLAEPDPRYGESVMKRTTPQRPSNGAATVRERWWKSPAPLRSRLRQTVVAAAILAAAAGISYYLWAARGAAGPPPPPVPAALTDPPARKVVESKRQAVLAAPHSGTAWG